MASESCKVLCLEDKRFFVVKVGSYYTDGWSELTNYHLSETIKSKADRQPFRTPVALMPFNLLQFNTERN
jgi:hypothetical protein